MLDKNGFEIPDPTPMAVPLHFKRPPSLQEQIQQMVRGELSRRAASQGHETFDEAEDFDVGDDFDPKSPWEINFDQSAALDAARDAYHKAMEEQRLKGRSDGKIKDDPVHDDKTNGKEAPAKFAAADAPKSAGQ